MCTAVLLSQAEAGIKLSWKQWYLIRYLMRRLNCPRFYTVACLLRRQSQRTLSLFRLRQRIDSILYKWDCSMKRVCWFKRHFIISKGLFENNYWTVPNEIKYYSFQIWQWIRYRRMLICASDCWSFSFLTQRHLSVD